MGKRRHTCQPLHASRHHITAACLWAVSSPLSLFITSSGIFLVWLQLPASSGAGEGVRSSFVHEGYGAGGGRDGLQEARSGVVQTFFPKVKTHAHPFIHSFIH